MTVTYNLDVSSSSLFSFFKLQLRWRGSIWKSVLTELILFTTVFGLITYIYRSPHILSAQQRQFWDDFSALFDQTMDYIPLTFMLGFFVTIIVGRWNDIFNNIGWIDSTALVLSTYMRGADEKTRMARRNIVRYMVLSQALLFRDVSMQVRRRYPALETLVASGLMTDADIDKYNACPQKYSKYFLPLQWCFGLLYEARSQGKIGADLMVNEIIKHITDFRRGLAQLSNYDWVPIPLVYPQVVFLAVRVYFFLCLIARQSVLIDGAKPEHPHALYPFVPFIMTALQFIFFVGWMKVAESMMNPLGEDDSDFECNFLLDRNLAVGFSIVDDNYGDIPQQSKDKWFSSEMVDPLYSADAATRPINPQIGSAAVVQNEADEIVMMHHVDADVDDDYCDDGEGARLLPRGISVVSVNHYDSRMSLASRKNGGMLDSIKKTFSRKVSVTRPSRLGSQMSLNNQDRPICEVKDENDIIDQLADESSRNQALLTPDDFSPTRRASPVADIQLTSVPEEDEEAQRTRTSVDLARWKRGEQ